MNAASRPGPIGFRVIGAFKLASAVLLVAAGFGVFRMVHRDVGTVLEHYVSRLHLDPDNRLVHDVIGRAAGLDPAHLKAIGAGSFFYAALHVLEGVGLLLGRRWAGFVTVGITGSLLPLELYELARKVTPLRAGVLAVNLAILAYLVVKLIQERREAGVGGVAVVSSAERHPTTS